MLNKLIRVNVADKKITEEELKAEYKYLSGKGLSSRIVFDEVPPTAHPLGYQNKLVFTCGLIAGTAVSSANRLIAGAKSPLTGGIKESNAGGIAGYKMGRLGIRAIILEGLPLEEEWYILVINKDGAALKKVDDLHGKGVYEKTRLLTERYGKNMGLILLGPAGEKRLLSAGITNTDGDGSPGRYCGRGGLGAVMGSKKVLAVVLDDSGCQAEAPADPELFKTKTRELGQSLVSSVQTGQVWPKYGTVSMLNNTQALGGLPTRNFQTGRFDGAEKINAEAMHDLIKSRGGEGSTTHACMPGCVIRCSNIFPDEQGKTIVSPVEYETICLLGSNLEIDDLDVVAKLNYLCNDFGIDTIETGCAIGVAMEAGVIPFGDKEGTLRLMDEVIRETYLGRIIASGAEVAGKVFGVRRVPAVKGQGMAAYEPRSIKGTAITYATSPMGADHTYGNLVKPSVSLDQKKELVKLSRDMQIRFGIYDNTGFCMFVNAGVKDHSIIADLINARHGFNLTMEDLTNMTRENIKLEKEFNKRAGFTKAHDRLPEHFYVEPSPATGTVYDITEEDLEEMVF